MPCHEAIMGTAAIDIPERELDAFCRKWRIRELALFGSVLRSDFGPDSDVDVLVTFDADARWSLVDLLRAESELQQLFNRPVDLIGRSAVQRSENWIRRKSILESARTVYAR
jgi:predicted nucleotidyltransferase